MKATHSSAPGVGPLIVLDRATRTYSGSPPVDALTPISLTIDRGEFVSIVGPSGSGKSTLLNILGLLDAPTDGSYLLAGNDVNDLTDGQRTIVRARLVGFVFQAFHLVAYRTALENVELGLLYQGVPRRQRVVAASVALQQVGLGHRMHATPDTLSGGERQRVAIARAVAPRPEVLLCDEPTGNLDTETTGQVLELLHQLNTDGITIVVITHDPEVASWTQRSIHIRDGAIQRR
jgi:putative ABC transport system ATP-binding protein